MVNVNTLYTVGLAILSSGVVHALVLKFFGPKSVTVIEKAVEVAKEAKPAVVEGIQAVEELAKLPAFAELKLKLLEEKRKLEDSELAKVAAAALHAFETSFNTLSKTQQGTLVAFVHAEMSKNGFNVTEQSIVRALNVVQSFADGVKNSDAFKHTAALEQSLKALDEPAPAAATNTPAEAVQTTA